MKNSGNNSCTKDQLSVSPKDDAACLVDNHKPINSEDDEILEKFMQKIHALQCERELLEVRLENVENDYDLQIKELQTDIIYMRRDLQKQKCMYRRLEDEKNAAVTELCQQNESLSLRLQDSARREHQLKKEINDLRSQCIQRKTSIHEHFNLLDSLRQEITKLREEKNRLETDLISITEERDQMIDALSDCYKKINGMEQLQQEHFQTINNQDIEIAFLQEKADSLQKNLQRLSNRNMDSSVQQSSSFNVMTSSVTCQPHRSLLAELAEQRLQLMNSGDFAIIEEDDDVEMDDEALLAYAASLNDDRYDIQINVQQPSTSRVDQDDTEDDLIKGLCSEVSEIYQQMRQMCVEVQALSDVKSVCPGGSLNGGGTYTPDELAMVEMNFRLSSLKSVLGDLRGLLRELTVERPTSVPLLFADKSNNPPLGSNQQFRSNHFEDSGMETPSSTFHLSEHEAMIVERDNLAAEIANAQQQISNIRQQLEKKADKNLKNSAAQKLDSATFIANWEEFDDEKYEFELPR